MPEQTVRLGVMGGSGVYHMEGMEFTQSFNDLDKFREVIYVFANADDLFDHTGERS